MKRTKLISVLTTSATILLTTCWTGSAQAAGGPWNDNALGAIWNYDPAGQCANLTNMQIPREAIGLPTTGAVVTSATFKRTTDTGNTNGEYCLVLGAIHPVDPAAPNINFRVNLPTNWNGKAVQMGGGGYNGVIPNTIGKTTLGSGTAPLTLGYITLGDDSGHKAADSNDASFAVNDESMLNYGYMHIKKAKDVMYEIARARYGKWPKRLYFSGGSTGGREGLTAAQRWPNDYDGILTNYPTANFLGLRLWGSFLAFALYPDNSAGWISPALANEIAAYAIAQCDGLDGIVDGLVSNIPQCRANSSQVLAHFKCPRAGGAECPTPTFIARTNQVYHEGYSLSYALANGIKRYEGYNSLESVIMDLGTDPHLYNPVRDGPNAHHVARADQFVRYFVEGNPPNYSLMNFDPANPGVWLDRVQYISNTIDATDPDMRKFMVKGGKILWLHGTEDASVAPFANARYYESIVATMGQKEVDSFMRFYMVPGLAHGGGNFSPVWDNLAVLDNWVENGVTPPDMPTATCGKTGCTHSPMPLCKYPSWPKYVAATASYTCEQTSWQYPQQFPQ